MYYDKHHTEEFRILREKIRALQDLLTLAYEIFLPILRHNTVPALESVIVTIEESLQEIQNPPVSRERYSDLISKITQLEQRLENIIKDLNGEYRLLYTFLYFNIVKEKFFGKSLGRHVMKLWIC